MLAACGGGGSGSGSSMSNAAADSGGGGGSGSSSAAGGSLPVVSLALSSSSIPAGQTVTVTWTTTNSTSCTAGGGAWSGTKPTSGSTVFQPTSAGAMTYTLTCSNSAGSSSSATAALNVTSPVGGAGASLPYVEMEAENGATNGTVIGPSRTFGDMAAEASGRRAVQLASTGQYVKFKTTAQANSIVLRYSIPDAPKGGGINATLGLYVNGVRTQSLNLTSRYSWVYGGPDNSSDKNPADGGAHHFYDEVHALIGEVPAGSTIALQRDAQDTASFYVIDLVDFEEVPAPLAQPAGSISIASYGAVPNNGSDCSAAVQAAIDAAQQQGAVLWIPPGTFELASAALQTSGIAIRGAGMWYSVLHGAYAHIVVSGNNNQFHDFAVFGDVTYRDDSAPNDGFAGSAGTGSVMENVWIEHVKVGWWVSYVSTTPPVTAPTDGLLVTGVRVRDTYADGINMNSGTSNSTVTQSAFRNTGDDSIASYSQAGLPSNTGNVISFDTVQTPWRARCFTVAGGQNTSVEDSVCSDSLEHGIVLTTSRAVTPFVGPVKLTRNTLVRAGGQWVDAMEGAFDVEAVLSPIPAYVQAYDLLIVDSTLSGVQVEGPYAVSSLGLSNVFVQSAGTNGILIDPTAVGSAAASEVVVVAPAVSGLDNLAGPRWTFQSGANNNGW